MSGSRLVAGALIAVSWSLFLAVVSVAAMTASGYKPGVRYEVPVEMDIPYCLPVLELGPGYCTTYFGGQVRRLR